MGTGLLGMLQSLFGGGGSQSQMPNSTSDPGALSNQQVQQLANQTATAMANNPQPSAAATANPPGMPMLGSSQQIANAIAGPSTPTAAPANTGANALGSLSQSLMAMGQPGNKPAGSTQVGAPAPQPQGGGGPQMSGMGAAGGGGGGSNSMLAAMMAPAFAASSSGGTGGPALGPAANNPLLAMLRQRLQMG